MSSPSGPNAPKPLAITITNVFGSYNRGDALLVESLHDAIRSAVGEQATISGLAHFPELEREHLPDVQWHRPPGRSYRAPGWKRRAENVARVAGVGVYALLGAPRWLEWIAPAEQLSGVRAIKNCDVVISCAGGFLIDTNLSILGNLAQLAIAQRFGRPIILAPQTIGPIRREWIRPLLRHILNRCDVICAREGFTFDFLNALGVQPSRVVRMTDLALYHDRVDKTAGAAAAADLGIGPDEPIIGCSVVKWSFPRSDDPRASYARYFERMCDTLRRINALTGRRILLVNQVSSDLPLSTQVAEAVGDIVVFDQKDRTPGEMRGLIRRCDSFLGSRFHSCVFSLLERVPTVSLAYSYKSTGIMNDLGLGDRVFDIDDFDPETVAGILAQDLQARPAQVARIEAGFAGISLPRFDTVLRDFVATKIAGSPGGR